MKDLYAQPDLVLGTKAATTFTIDLTKSLGDGETLETISGTDPHGNILGASVSDAELDYDIPVINTGAITSTRTGDTIAIGKAIQIRLIGKECRPGKDYVLTIVVTTTNDDTIQVMQKVTAV